MEQNLLKEKNKATKSNEPTMASANQKRKSEITTADNAVTAQQEQLLALLCLKKKVSFCMLVCLLRS